MEAFTSQARERLVYGGFSIKMSAGRGRAQNVFIVDFSVDFSSLELACRPRPKVSPRRETVLGRSEARSDGRTDGRGVVRAGERGESGKEGRRRASGRAT